MTKFNTLVIDPPWPISMTGKVKRKENRAESLPYQTMTLDAIKTMEIPAAPGAHVYLWCTNKTLRDAYDVLDAWGLNFHLCLVMAKPSGIAPAMGYVFGTEFCLLAFAGKPMQKFKDIGALNWFGRGRSPHSTKPDHFYELVERMSPGPYADIFARRKREGWSVWGDEVVSDFQMTSAPAQ